MPITEGGGVGVKLLPTKGASGNEEAKKKKQLILLAVLVPILLFLIYNNVLKKPSAPSVPTPPAPSQSASVESPSSVVSAPISQEQLGTLGGSFKGEELGKGSEDEWGRSPFSLKSQAEEEAGLIALRLEGIMYSAEGSYAVINEEIVRENDRIADNVVKEIRQDEVVLRSDEDELLVLKV